MGLDNTAEDSSIFMIKLDDLPVGLDDHAADVV